MSKNSVGLFDRIGSAISYSTAGWGGIAIWVLLYLKKSKPSKFLMFNILQSIFISVLFFVISMGFEIIANVLRFIPFVNYVVAQISFLLNRPLFFGRSLFQLALVILFGYLIIYSLLGKQPKIYWISRIVNRNAK